MFVRLFVLLLLSAQPTKGTYVRRMPEKKSEDSPPLIPPGLFGIDNRVSISQFGPEKDQAIRNGHEIAALPWYAVFQSRTLCGGSLIHGDIILTASHCVDDNGLPERVRVGSSDYWRGGTVTNVVGGVLHPGWTWHRASDPDLAILVLEDFLPNQVAVLNSDPNIPVADHPSLFAMGFGLKNDKQTSRNLLGASIPYLDNCSSRSYTYERNRHLCCDSAHIATCGGDSGSPITLDPSSNLQVGINSYSNGKCSTQTLDIYTRVSHFHDWIQQKVCELSKDPPKRCSETSVPTPTPTVATSVPTPTPTVATEQPSEPTFVPSVSPSIGETNVATSAPTTATPTMPTVPADTVAPTKDSSDDSDDDEDSDDDDESPPLSPPSAAPSPAETNPPSSSSPSAAPSPPETNPSSTTANTEAPTTITSAPTISTSATTIITPVPTTTTTTTPHPSILGTSSPTLNATRAPTP